MQPDVVLIAGRHQEGVVFAQRRGLSRASVVTGVHQLYARHPRVIRFLPGWYRNPEWEALKRYAIQLRDTHGSEVFGLD